MRIPITLVIEMTDEQVQQYANEYGLSDTRAKTVVDDVRSNVLSDVRGLLDSFGTVTIKR